ncbi:MAG: AAA family ATPase, partial [Candidatus Latescibacteria bacterium]|nr:AAA family ATPase [Candidatus Latescibacterota bacterium]
MRRAYQATKRTVSIPEEQYTQTRSIWILRTLLYTDAHNEFLRREDNKDENIMRVIGMKPIEKSDSSGKTVLKSLRKELIRLEKSAKQESQMQCTLFKNIKKLKQQINLTNSQENLLAFFAIVKNEKVLEESLDYIGDINSSSFCHILSEILNCNKEVVSKDLKKNSSLVSSGIIKLEKGLTYFSVKFDMLEGLEDLLLKEDTNSTEILDSFFQESKLSELTIDSFPHLKADIDILLPVLKSAQKEKTKGINILIYGIPGTGKTEFVKVVTEALKTNLYEINVEDPDGDPISGQVRFKAYQLCQKLFQSKVGIIMFDEIEDVFPDVSNFVFLKDNSGKNKGWINKVLESNHTPAFWISNSVFQIDPAYLRRFDYVMELKTPPKQVRERIIRDSLKKIPVDEDCIKLLAKNEHITPAQINKAAKIAMLAKPTSSEVTAQIIKKVINNDLDLKGISKKVNQTERNKIQYNLS